MDLFSQGSFMVMAIRVHATGGPEVLRWEDIGELSPGAGQLLVRNTAIAVNMVEVYQRTGRPHPNQPALPYVPGSVHVGVVEACGDGVPSVLQPGTRVVCMGSFGAYAQKTVVAAGRTVVLPQDVDDVLAAAIYVRGLTAYYLTHLHHVVEPGQVCVVHAAAGGLGQLLCCWIAALGATVIGTVSSQAKRQIALDAGCKHVVVRNDESTSDKCREWTGGRGVDVVYDSIGKDTVRESLTCLRPGGHVIVCGAASGTVESLSLEWLHAGSLKVSRPTVMTYVKTSEQLQAASTAVFGAMRQGILQLNSVASIALRDAADAHRSLESRTSLQTPVLIN